MVARFRVFLWCLLASCSGGPITDFPDGLTGGDDHSGAGSKPPSVPAESAGDGDGDVKAPPLSSGDDDNAGEFLGDSGASSAGDAGIADSPDRPCAPHVPGDAGRPESGDGGVCSGGQCPITRSGLARQAHSGGACTSSLELDLVCDGRIQSSIGTCNETSLQESASFSLVENCVLTDPALSWASEACIDCYLDANRCALLNCLAECLAPTSTQSCNACRATHCGPALSACTGLPAL